jgi:hypothetical protein
MLLYLKTPCWKLCYLSGLRVLVAASEGVRLTTHRAFVKLYKPEAQSLNCNVPSKACISFENGEPMGCTSPLKDLSLRVFAVWTSELLNPTVAQ